MKKIIAASNNKNKIKEIKQILSDTGYEILSLADAGIDVDPEETSNTFEGNALIKARAASEFTNFMVLADDSGLEVDCLEGLPGVKSKRYAGENASDDDNNRLLLRNLGQIDSDNFSARFKCVIAVVSPNGTEETFYGSCEGEIVNEPIGDKGFGYDPIFYIPDYKRTMAQLDDNEKNKISHRGAALEKVRDYLKELNK